MNQFQEYLREVYLSMAMPVIVKVETNVMQTGPIADKWHNHWTLGPIHLLYSISTKVNGLTTVHKSRSPIAKLTMSMLLT